MAKEQCTDGAESVRGPRPLTFTVLVLVHSIMHMCDPRSLLRLARCSRQLFADASSRFAWKAISDGFHVKIHVDKDVHRPTWRVCMNAGRAILRLCVRRPRPWLNDPPHVDPLITRANASLLRFCDLDATTYYATVDFDDDTRLEKMRHLANVRSVEGGLDLVCRLPPVLTRVNLFERVVRVPSTLHTLSYAQPNVRELRFHYRAVRHDLIEDENGTHEVSVGKIRFPALVKCIMQGSSHPNQHDTWIANMLENADSCLPVLVHLQITEELLRVLHTNVSARSYAALDATLRTLVVTGIQCVSDVLAFVQTHLPSLTSVTMIVAIADMVNDVTFRALSNDAFDEPLHALLEARPTLGRVAFSLPSLLSPEWTRTLRAWFDYYLPDVYTISVELNRLRSRCERSAQTFPSRVHVPTTACYQPRTPDDRTLWICDPSWRELFR